MPSPVLKQTAAMLKPIIDSCKGNRAKVEAHLTAMGGRKIGCGAYKDAWELNGVILKMNRYALNLKTADAVRLAAHAVREKTRAPPKMKPFMADTTRCYGLVIQEKCARVLGTGPAKEYESAARKEDQKRKDAMNTLVATLTDGAHRFTDLGLSNMGIREDGSLVVFDGWPTWSGNTNDPVRKSAPKLGPKPVAKEAKPKLCGCGCGLAL